MNSAQSTRDPVDLVHERIQGHVAQAKAAARGAIRAREWICDDGHRHARPATFTFRRLATEVGRRHPKNGWTSSEIALGIRALVDDGEIYHDNHWLLHIND